MKYTHCIYLAYKEGVLKIGKSTYQRRHTRGFELRQKEELLTVRRYNLTGDETKALFFESCLRSKVAKHYKVSHYGLDHFTADITEIQKIVDDFSILMEQIAKVYKRI